MIMADVLLGVAVVVATLLLFVACWLASEALVPRWVAICEARGSKPWSTLAWGCAALLPLLLVAGTVSKAGGPGKGLAAALLLLLAGAALIGTAGLASRIGRGLEPPGTPDHPWRRMTRGGPVLALVFLVPLLGWFLILPAALLWGWGAWLIAVTRRAPPDSVAAPESEPSPQAATDP